MSSLPFLTSSRGRLLRFALLFGGELAILAVIYQFHAEIDCQQTGSVLFCRFLRSLVARGLVVLAVIWLLLQARPQLLARLAEHVRPAARAGWSLLHLAGLGLLLLPVALAPGGDLGAIFGWAVWLLAAGAICAAFGALLWLAPLRAWSDLLFQDRGAPVIALILAALLPDLAEMAQPIWEWRGPTEATFDAVHAFLSVFSSDVRVRPEENIIGYPEFSVYIAQACSGVEGIALVGAFTLIYGMIFRRTVRLPLLFAVVLPAAMALSWLFNVVRVGTLILIGRHVSPDLAVNGFHSYAGWVFFTILALLIVTVVQASPWLHREPLGPVAGPELRRDPVAAMLLPFAAFMAASLLTHAFFPHPEIGYPIRVLAMLAALWPFRQLYLGMGWTLDGVAILAGLAVGLGWLWFDPADPAAGMELAAALGGLPGWALAVWIVARLAGTTLLVPLVEELFFRGYLLLHMPKQSPVPRIAALILSTVCFAALHGRWVAAGVAGLLFGLVALRGGRVASAVQAHMAANVVVAAWAFITSDFARI